MSVAAKALVESSGPTLLTVGAVADGEYLKRSGGTIVGDAGGGGGGPPLSSATPQPLGTAGAGASTDASRADHVHAMPKLDDLNPPDDNTDLNVSTSAHGLVPKAPNDTGKFLRGDATWARPLTRQAVSTATALSGTADLLVGITASFNGAITLPAANTAGRLITITDEAGVGSGDANGASSNLIHVLCAGSDTITAPDMATSRARLLLWKRYGTITLLDDGAGGWHAITRRGWHVDPRTVSGLKCWYDSRRGITLNGNAVSAWADLSGGGVNLAQSTAADQPGYIYASSGSFAMGSDHNLVTLTDTSDYCVSTVTPAFSSGALALFGAFIYDFGRAASSTEILFQSNPTASLGFFWSLNNSSGVGGAPSGSAYIAANNTASNDFITAPRNWTTANTDMRIQMVQLRVSAPYTRAFGMYVYGTGQSGSGASAVSSFTQTIRVGNTIGNCRVGHLMAFDADLSYTDVFDLERAIAEVFPARS